MQHRQNKIDPKTLDAEKRVLSSMLHTESACIKGLSALKDEDFQGKINRDIFLLIQAIYETGRTPTVPLLLQEGLKIGYITDIKKKEEVQAIYDFEQDHQNIDYWALEVKKISKSHKAKQLLRDYYNKIDGAEDIDQFIADVGDNFFDLATDRNDEDVLTGTDICLLAQDIITERVEKYKENMEEFKKTGEFPLEGVNTGFPELNRLFLGYKPGDLILVGAQTGHGKTAFALNTAKSVCVDHRESLLYMNTEMSREQIVFRWGGMLSNVPIHDIRIGRLENADYRKVLNSFKKLEDTGLVMLNERRLNVHRMNMLVRKYVLQRQVKLAVLDYVGRMEKRDPKLAEWQALEDIAKEMKILAQDLDVACMVLFQLNRDDTIQGSSRMKNEADLMLTIHPLPEDEDAAETFRQRICNYRKKQFEYFDYYIKVEKSRDSASGLIVPVVFDKELQIMREARETERNRKMSEWEELGTDISR